MSNLNRIFKIGGYDISSYVLTLSGIRNMQKKPEWGGLPETPRLELELVNTTGAFSPSADVSIFYGAELKEFTIEVILEQGTSRIVEWSGSLENLELDYQTQKAKIIGITKFSKLLDTPALLNLDVDTPAEISRQVFDLFNIEYDSVSFSYASSLQSGLVNVALDPNLLESTITLMEVQKQLASAGYGRIYPYNNKMYYEVFESDRNPSITADLTDKDVMFYPKESKIEHDNTAYQVEYIDGTAESEGYVSDSNSQKLDFGANATVKIQSLTGATQVADQWELISQIKKRVLELGVTKELGYILDIGSFINFTWESAYIYSEIYEITGIDRTDPRYTILEIQSI